MLKKGVYRIAGNTSPKVGVETLYAIAEWYPDTPILERNPAKVTWELFRKRNNGKFTSAGIKKVGISSFTFGEKAWRYTYKLEAYLHTPEGKEPMSLIINPQQSKVPKINKVELHYVDDAKGNTFSFFEKLVAKAHCVNLANEELIFTLWEDDAKGGGHDPKNLFVASQPAKVKVSNGIATAEFTLTEGLMKKAMRGEHDGQLEFYVTVEYFKNKKHESEKVNVNNPLYKKTHEVKHKTPVQEKKPAQNQPKAKGSPAEQKPKSKKEEKGILSTIGDTGKVLYDYVESALAKATKDKDPNKEVSNTSKTVTVKDPDNGKKDNKKCPNCENDITLEQIKQICVSKKNKKGVETCLVSDDTFIKAALPFLNKYRKEFGINTCIAKTHFLAQISQESKFYDIEEGFNYYREALISTFSAFQSREGKEKAKLWGRAIKDKSTKGYAAVSESNQINIANWAYKDNNGNGSFSSGDGSTYRGRGFKQITWKSNYEDLTVYFNAKVKNDKIDWSKNPLDLSSKSKDAITSAFAFWGKNNINGVAKEISNDSVKSVTKIINPALKALEERERFFWKAVEVLKTKECKPKSNNISKKDNLKETYDSEYKADQKTAYIDIIVPSDRKKEGLLVFFNDTEILHKCYVLGLGTGGEDRYTNGGYGNVPNGLWNTKQELNIPNEKGVPYPNSGVSFGNHGTIRLSPKAGDALNASKRSGILIHCGHTMGDGKKGLTDNGALMVTHGCIRVYNADMPIIQKIYTQMTSMNKKVYVYIEETEDISSVFKKYGVTADPKDIVIRKNKKYDAQ